MTDEHVEDIPRTGSVVCSQCGREVDFSIVWQDHGSFVLRGAALPFSDGLKTELARRQMAALCIPCWKGQPVAQMPIMEVLKKQKIITEENE